LVAEIATIKELVGALPRLLEEIDRLRDTVLHRVAARAPEESRRHKTSSAEFPVYLYEWRRSRGKSLDDLTMPTGLSPSQLSRVENGLQSYNQQILEGYAKALGCRPADLITRPPTDPLLVLDPPLLRTARNWAKPPKTDRRRANDTEDAA
jgi:transcriptional regulator with XRE-family HTH domain